MSIILIPTMLVVALSFFVSFHSAASLHKDVVLNVALPQEARQDTRVQALVRGYKKANALASLLFLAAGFLVILPDKISLIILFLTLWVALTLLGGNAVLEVYSRKLRILKREQGWHGRDARTVSVDLIVSREKESMPISPVWFLPPLLSALTLLVWGALRGKALWPTMSSLLGLLLYCFFYALAARDRARAYCGDTEINLALTRTSIRSWTRAWVILANAQGLLMSLSYLPLYTNAYSGPLPLILLEPLAILATLVWTAESVRRNRERILAGVGGTITVDDDRFWRGGLYNNPEDKRLLVEKRVGFGYTLNCGAPAGKVIYYGTLVGVLVLLLGLFLVFSALDNANYALEIRGDRVFVQAPLYGCDFPLADIRSVTQVNTMPEGLRTNGAETGNYCLGNFNINGYGKSKVFVYKGKPPYLVIELPELYVFFNARTEAETEEYLSSLMGLIGR